MFQSITKIEAKTLWTVRLSWWTGGHNIAIYSGDLSLIPADV